MTQTMEAQDQHEQIEAHVRALYVAFLDQDRARFDARLDPEVTVWESHFSHLFTKAELDKFRDDRGVVDTSQYDSLDVEMQQIDVMGDISVARYLMKIVVDSIPVEVFRVTDVLRRVDGNWLIIHHHSERVAEE